MAGEEQNQGDIVVQGESLREVKSFGTELKEIFANSAREGFFGGDPVTALLGNIAAALTQKNLTAAQADRVKDLNSPPSASEIQARLGFVEGLEDIIGLNGHDPSKGELHKRLDQAEKIAEFLGYGTVSSLIGAIGKKADANSAVDLHMESIAALAAAGTKGYYHGERVIGGNKVEVFVDASDPGYEPVSYIETGEDVPKGADKNTYLSDGSRLTKNKWRDIGEGIAMSEGQEWIGAEIDRRSEENPDKDMDLIIRESQNAYFDYLESQVQVARNQKFGIQPEPKQTYAATNTNETGVSPQTPGLT